MNQFNDQDIINLLIKNENSPEGVFNQVSWHTIAGNQSDDQFTRLVSLHESFHHELNNITSIGFLLQTYASLFKVTKNEKYRTILREMIKSCRTSHEVYATFRSTVLIAESIKQLEKSNPLSLLEKYPTYIDYFSLANQLTNDFDGNYLKEIALSAIIINLFQSKIIHELAYENLTNFSIEPIYKKELPDNRLSFLLGNLKSGYLKNIFANFCDQHSNDPVLEIFLKTEFDHSYYKEATSEACDSLHDALLDRFIRAIHDFFNEHGFSTVAFHQKDSCFQQLVEKANQITLPLHDYELMRFNTNPYNSKRNIFLNFSNEHYCIRDKKITARIIPIEAIAPVDRINLAVGDKNNQHFFLIVRVAQRLLDQYLFTSEEKAWLLNKKEEVLVFLRCRVVLQNEPQVYLYWFQNLEEWAKFFESNSNIPRLSNISLHSVYLPTLNQPWFKELTVKTIITLLFDIAPYQEIEQLNNSPLPLIRLNKVWIQHENYKHCALVMQGFDDESNIESPIYFLPGSELTCNVISNYLIQVQPNTRYIEDKQFIEANSWVIRTVLSHLLNEETVFDFYFLH